MSLWLKTAKDNLFQKSVEKKDFIKALSEFQYINVEDNENSDFTCELCQQPNIRYEYLVKNKINDNTLKVGSECIKKFIGELDKENIYLLDENDNKVTIKRLESDKKEYFKDITLRLMKYYWKNNLTDFKIAILNAIEDNKSITINQAKHLTKVYKFGLDRDERYGTAMRNTIKINMTRKMYKNQYYDLTEKEKDFVKLFMSYSQKEKL